MCCCRSGGAQVLNSRMTTCEAWRIKSCWDWSYLRALQAVHHPESVFDVWGDWSQSSCKLRTHSAISQSVNQYMTASGRIFSHCDKEYETLSGSRMCHIMWCGPSKMKNMTSVFWNVLLFSEFIHVFCTTDPTLWPNKIQSPSRPQLKFFHWFTYTEINNWRWQFSIIIRLNWPSSYTLGSWSSYTLSIYTG